MRRRTIEVTHAAPNTPTTADPTTASSSHGTVLRKSLVSVDSRVPTETVPITLTSSGA